MTDGINTLRYSDFFLAMYFDGGKSCLHRNHSHVLVYMYSGEMVIDERGKTTRLHKGDNVNICLTIFFSKNRKDGNTLLNLQIGRAHV